MSEFHVVLAPAAENDVADAFGWYKQRNATAADAFRTEGFAVLDRLAEAPLSYPADDDGNRRRVIKRFPFSRGTNRSAAGAARAVSLLLIRRPTLSPPSA